MVDPNKKTFNISVAFVIVYIILAIIILVAIWHPKIQNNMSGEMEYNNVTDGEKRCQDLYLSQIRFYLKEQNSDELLKKRSLLSKVMALEKSKDIKDFIQVSNKISEMKMPKEHKDFLSRMIYYIFKGKIGEDNANKLLNKLTNNLVKKEGDGFMFVNVINNWIDEAIELAEDITRKQEDIDRKQEDIDRKQEDIDRKQEDINTKQADIEQREENIEKREKNIKKGEKIIAEREKNMQQKEREIKRRQDEIIIEMIKKEISEDLIIEIAKIDKKELERIKKVNKL